METKQKVNELLEEMTLEEKAALCVGMDFWHFNGVSRLDIPEIMVSDGPHGLRKQAEESDHLGVNKSVEATCFPTAVTLASTWNPKLLYRVGEALANECLAEDVSVLLGPGVNIKRSPLCGRNFEYFSEDPYQAGEMGAALVQGIQSRGVGTSVKHFAANNQEYYRMTIDERIDIRTLHEIYLSAFERIVKKARPKTLMCAYNQVNGTYASENKYLLTQILRDMWGFEGLVMTDWGASNLREKGLEAGLDVEMPGLRPDEIERIIQKVKDNSLDEAYVDASAKRVLELILDVMDNKDKVVSKNYFDDNHALAKEASQEGMVLLKNEGCLPLDSKEKVLIVGEMAKKPRYQGAGSSLINAHNLTNAFDYCPYPKLTGYTSGYSLKTTDVDLDLIEEAVKKAETYDKILLFTGLTDREESEGFDRKDMSIPISHQKLIEAIYRVNPNIILILSNGAPIEMPWIDKVSGILETYLPGEAGGEAIWDILYGKVSPSGKLAESFPKNYDKTAIKSLFPMGPRNVDYREGLYVGYRYFDQFSDQLLFPFGFGLSYTTFTYSKLHIEEARGIKKDMDIPMFVVKFTVTNTGRMAGKEIAQVYVHDLESTQYRPFKELKGFCKVSLEANESKEVSVVLERRDFAAFDQHRGDWIVEEGDVEILVGPSSKDLPLKQVLFVPGIVYPYSEAHVFHEEQEAYYELKTPNFSKEGFDKLYGENLKDIQEHKKGSYTMNSTFREFLNSSQGEQILKEISSMEENELVEQFMDETSMFGVMVRESPLRSLVMFSNGLLSYKMLSQLVEEANNA